jgi:hypothetical protein
MYAQNRRNYLFSGDDLYPHLQQRITAAREAIMSMPEAQIMATPENDIVQHMVERFCFDPIRLYVEQMQAESDETQVDVAGDRNRFFRGEHSGSFMVPGLKITYTIPYTGDAVLWSMRASSYTSMPPTAECTRDKLIIIVSQPNDSLNPEAIKSHYEKTIQSIQQYLSFQEGDIAANKSAIDQAIRSAIADRKQALQKHKSVLEMLNIPIRPQGEAPVFNPMPIKKVIVPLPPPPKSGFQPEPGITDDIYEHILNVIRHEGRSWESAPKTFAKHDEEELRDIILAHLNTHFQGQASGETFRKAGKTDIRIEADNRSAFIAECKVWSGQKQVSESVDQMLSYLTWRDCKTALVFFNKSVAGFTDIRSKVLPALQVHSKFKKLISDKGDNAEWQAVFKSPHDDLKEVTVHVFLFNIYPS